MLKFWFRFVLLLYRFYICGATTTLFLEYFNILCTTEETLLFIWKQENYLFSTVVLLYLSKHARFMFVLLGICIIFRCCLCLVFFFATSMQENLWGWVMIVDEPCRVAGRLLNLSKLLHWKQFLRTYFQKLNISSNND